jgi:hypothetical protein
MQEFNYVYCSTFNQSHLVTSLITDHFFLMPRWFASFVIVFPFFPFVAHRRESGCILHWCYTALLFCLVDVEELRGEEGLWLLVIAGEDSSPTIVKSARR